MTDAPDLQAGIVLDVDHLIGVPWVEGGRDFRRTGGTDCLGIVLHVVRDVLGIPAVDPWDELADRWRDRRFDIGQALPSGWTPVGAPYHPGDVAVTDRGFHVSVYTGGGWFLSCSREVGVHRWAQKRPHTPIVGVWRWTGGQA